MSSASLLGESFDVVYPGLATSDEEGACAREAFGRANVGIAVIVPAMAAPPNYAVEALAGLDVPIVVWNAPLVDMLGADLD